MRVPLVLTIALVALPLAGCGGGSEPAAAKTQAPAPTTAPATAPADVAAATAEVKANWAAFFDGSKPGAQRAALIEDGAHMAAAIAAGAKSPGANATRSTVTAVSFTSPTDAAVTYNLAVSGKNVLTGAQGKAVLDQGQWKVSKFTFCQLLKLGSGGAPVPGCA